MFCILDSASDNNYIFIFRETDYHKPDIEEDTSLLFALVMNGHSLVHVFHPQVEKMFLEVSTMCKLLFYPYSVIYIFSLKMC